MLSANVKVNFNEAAFRRKIRNIKRNMLQAGANTLRTIIQSNIATSGPPASVPGEYPHLRTGNLQSNIRTNVNSQRAQVISSMPYSAAVEDSRPFMQRSLDENRRAVYDAMMQAGQRVMGGG